MKSKKVIIQKLRDPDLRNLRNSLRIILYLAIKDKIKQLLKVDSRINARFSSQLFTMLNKSMLNCSGGSLCPHSSSNNPYLDKNMIWVPWINGWSCRDCYKDFLLIKDDPLLGVDL